MRATWQNLRKAVNEIDTFKQLLHADSDNDARGVNTATEEVKSQWYKEPVPNNGGDRYSSPLKPNGSPPLLESSEQRMKMIESIGEVGANTGVVHTNKVTTGGNADPLQDFASQLISQYEGETQTEGSLFRRLVSSASSTNSRPSLQHSHRDYESYHGCEVSDEAGLHADTVTSVAIASRLYILYKMCCTLESLWKDMEGRAAEATGYSMAIQAMPRSSPWQECKSVHSEYTDKILSWLERSYHTMGLLADVLGMGDAKVLSSSGLLKESMNSSIAGLLHEETKGRGLSEETPGEYMRLVKLIMKIQTDYERRLQKLQSTQDSALLKATKTADLEKEVEALRERIQGLEEELQARNNDVRDLTDSLHNANAVKTQLVQKNEQLIASNQRLLMTKSESIDKDTVNKMIQQYYEHDRLGSQRRDDIIKLLESMLGIVPPTRAQDQLAQTDARTLANQFIDFLEDEPQN
ncbi:hypothetical protein BgAZ_500310 [Babesia gibsoni]|uniref:Uncharacterized protein n=1 Tax=Babesia gibsoni TaxID=33632 RepID=A0AAD8LIZ9_BABGI|nr:hypothetical protein BgAZ_500310 [Babesia gibsoni]